MTTPKFEVLAHVESIGDIKVGPNEYAGAQDKHKSIEGFQISFSAPAGVGLRYMAHIRSKGDTAWLKDGEFVGSRGQHLPLEGFAIELTGENARLYDILYMARDHEGKNTKWVWNGNFCGTRGKSLALSGIVITLVQKEMHFQRGYTQYNTNTSVPPSICTFKEQIHCFYQQQGDNRLTHIRSSNGLYWHDRREIRNIAIGTSRDNFIVTSAGPCSVVFDNKLYVFFRAEKADNVYYIVSPDGETWSAPQLTKCRSWSHLSVATLGDSLVVAYRNFEGDGIMFYKLWANGDSTTNNTGHDTSAARVGIVAFNNQYHIFYKDRLKHEGIMHMVSPTGESWNGAESFHVLNTETSASPAPVAYNGELHLFYRDNGGNAIYHVVSRDGDKFRWATPLNIGLDLDDGPSAAVLGDTLCLAGVDAGNKGIMRAVHFPLIDSALKGWDCIAALDLQAVPLPSCPGDAQRITVPQALRDQFLDVRLQPGVVDAAAHDSDAPLTVSFTVGAQVKAGQQGKGDSHEASARLVVAPSAKLVPSPDKAGRWDIMLDFETLSMQPRLEDVRGDPVAIGQLREALVSQVALQPALLLWSMDAPFGNEEMFRHVRFKCVTDPNRPKGILLVLLSNKDVAPHVDDHTFTPSVLPNGSDVALYVSNDRVIRLVGGIVQAKLRAKMGNQAEHGATDLTYEYIKVPNEPRVRAFTDKENCRFWDKSRKPQVDWSWVDAANSRLTVDLRLRVEVEVGPTTTGVYVEATPSLKMQIDGDRTRISFELEEPIPYSHETHGVAKWCADGEATRGAIELAKELGETLSDIKPIDFHGYAEFTHASINRLGELLIAASKKG